PPVHRHREVGADAAVHRAHRDVGVESVRHRYVDRPVGGRKVQVPRTDDAHVDIDVAVHGARVDRATARARVDAPVDRVRLYLRRRARDVEAAVDGAEVDLHAFGNAHGDLEADVIIVVPGPA